MESVKIQSDIQLANGIGSKTGFTIAANANIFDILSNKMYERPIEAIVREIYSNAIDANIKAKKTGGLEIELPTEQNPILRITDHGIGMDEAMVAEVFTQYGNSTKNADNSQIGGFGIGGKTPFAYTDQFTISSAYNGVETSYAAVREDTGPSLIKINSQAVSYSGTTVTVPVKLSDIDEFVNAAVKVLLFALEFPTISETSQAIFEKAVIDDGWKSLDDYLETRKQIAAGNLSVDLKGLRGPIGRVAAVIGGVVYTIDTSRLNGYEDFIEWKCLLLNIPVGALSVQASREKLNYDEKTVKLLNEYFKDAVVKLYQSLSDALTNKKLTYIEKWRLLNDYSVRDFDDLIHTLSSSAA